jgi:hypothetical protein
LLTFLIEPSSALSGDDTAFGSISSESGIELIAGSQAESIKSILLTSDATVFTLERGTSDCNTVENELREIFGHSEEYDWALVIEEEEDADQEFIEQRELSSEEATGDEIVVEESDREVVEVEVERGVDLSKKRRRREEDLLVEGVASVDGPRPRKRPSRYI